MSKKIEDWKIGDNFLVTKLPTAWSSLLHSTCPLFKFKPQLPYFGTIKELHKESDVNLISMTCGNYGWCLDSLIETNCIISIPKFVIRNESTLGYNLGDRVICINTGLNSGDASLFDLQEHWIVVMNKEDKGTIVSTYKSSTLILLDSGDFTIRYEHQKNFALKTINKNQTKNMEELKITKEKVLEAASKCSTAKETLKTLFPEVFKESLFSDIRSLATLINSSSTVRSAWLKIPGEYSLDKAKAIDELITKTWLS